MQSTAKATSARYKVLFLQYKEVSTGLQWQLVSEDEDSTN